LAEIAADAVHPILHLTVEELVRMLPATDLQGVCLLNSAEPSGFTGLEQRFAKQG
jgi:hypothetical protein